MGDDSSGKSESPPKEPAEKEPPAEHAPTTSKSTSVLDRIFNSKPPPKRRTRSKSPEIVFTDSDDPDGDMAPSKQTSKTPDPPKEGSGPSKEPEQPKSSDAKTTVSTDKPPSSSIPTSFKPLSTSTPKVVKVQAPTTAARGGLQRSYGVPGVVCVNKQSTSKGVSMPQVDFYKKYPWLKPTQPSARQSTTASTTSDSPVVSKSPTKTPGLQEKPGSQPVRPPSWRPTGAKPSTPFTPETIPPPPGSRPSFRTLAQPFNVTKLAGSSPQIRNLNKGANVATPENLKKPEPGSSQTSKHWKKPWSEMTVEERLVQRKKDMEEMLNIEDREDEILRLAHPRPPPTTVTPRITRISEDTIKRFRDTTSRNEALWKEGAPSTSAAGKNKSSDMRDVRDILKPIKMEPGSIMRGRPTHDPFAPPVNRPRPIVKKKRLSSLEKKGSAGDQQMSPEKGKSPVKKTGDGGEERQADDNNDFGDDFGGGGDEGGEGTANPSSSVIDVGSPSKELNVKGEKLDAAALKAKREMEQEARRQELLKPAMQKMYSEEMAAMAREKAKFEREVLEKMSKEQEKLPALPSYSQLQNLKNKPDDLKQAMDRLVDNMKRIGSTDDSAENPQGELTKHLNQMMESMKKDVFLGTVRHEVYGAEENMFEEAAVNYVKGSSMTKLSTEDYVRGAMAAKIARETKERGRMRAEQRREDQRRAKIIAVGPKGKIGKKELAKLTEAQRRRRSFPAPKTPPGSPRGNSPPVSTAGSRDHTPDRLPQPVTPSGSPPPLASETARKRAQASKRRMEVMLNESFDGQLDENDEEARKEYSLREKRKERDLKNLQHNYDSAMFRYKTLSEQKGRSGPLPASMRSKELTELMRDGGRYEWDSKMKELMRLTNTTDRDVFEEMDFSSDFPMDDLSSSLPSSSKTPSILNRGLQRTRGSGMKPTPSRLSKSSMDDSRMEDYGMDGMDDPMDEEERDIRNVVGAIKERERKMQPRKMQPQSKYERSLHASMQPEHELQLQQREKLQKRLSEVPLLPMTEEQLKEKIEEYTVLFEDLHRKLAQAKTVMEKEHLINVAITKSTSILNTMESAMRVEQVLPSSIPSSSLISSRLDFNSRVLVGDAGDDEDVVLKSKRAKHRDDETATDATAAAAADVSATDPAPTLTPVEGSDATEKGQTESSRPDSSSSEKEKGGEPVEAPPTLDPQQDKAAAAAEKKSRVENAAPVDAILDESGRAQVEAVREGMSKDKLAIKLNTNRMTNLWKMSENLPRNIKELARRALPTTDAAKAKAVLDLRSQIVSAEKMKSIDNKRRQSGLTSMSREPEYKYHAERINLEFSYRDKQKEQNKRKQFQKKPVSLHDAFDDATFDHGFSDDQLYEPTGNSSLMFGMDKKSRLRKEEELRRAEAMRLAKKREAEEKKEEEEKKKKRDRQRALLGGVVVGLKAGETLSNHMKRLPVDPSIDSSTVTKRKVLIRKELSLKERESLILAEFYKFWKEEKQQPKNVVDIAKDRSKGADSTAEKSPDVEVIEDIEDDEERERREKEKEKEGKEGEEQPGTSEPRDLSDQPPSLSVEAVKETEKGEGEGMKEPKDMEPHVKALYNQWRQMRKQAREVVLNTGNVVDEVELAEVEVPEGTTEENYEDTRPYQRKMVVIEHKKDVVVDEPGKWINTLGEPSLVLQLNEKQRIVRKKARGEVLTTNEKKFLHSFQMKAYTSSYKAPSLSVSDRKETPLKKSPIVFHFDNPVKKGPKLQKSGEGDRKRVVITRMPGGTTRLRVIRQSDTRPAFIEADVRATMDTMLNTICGVAPPTDALEAMPSLSPTPCYDAFSDEDMDTVAPPLERGTVSRRSIILKKNRVPSGFPTIIRSVRSPGGKSPAKTKTVIWKPEGKHKTSIPSAPYYTGKALTSLSYTPKKRPTSSTTNAPEKKDDVRAVLDEMLKKICGDEETPMRKKTTPIIWKPVSGKLARLTPVITPSAPTPKQQLTATDLMLEILNKEDTADALPVYVRTPKQKEINWKPVDKKTARRLATPATPMVTRTAPILRKIRDPVREVVDDMLKIVCAQVDAPRVSTVPRILRRIIVKKTVPKFLESTVVKKAVPPLVEIGDDDEEVTIVEEKKTGSDLIREKSGLSREPRSDPDDDIVEMEEDDEERGRGNRGESSGRQRVKVLKRRRKQKLEKALDSDDDEVTMVVEESEEEEVEELDRPDCLSLIKKSDGAGKVGSDVWKKARGNKFKTKLHYSSPVSKSARKETPLIIRHRDPINMPMKGSEDRSMIGEKRKVLIVPHLGGSLRKSLDKARQTVTRPASVEDDVRAVMDGMLRKICGETAPIIYRNPIRMPVKISGDRWMIEEGGRKKVVVIPQPGGCFKRVIRRPTMKDDVRAVMDEMMKKICGDDPADALESMPSHSLSGAVKKTFKNEPRKASIRGKRLTETYTRLINLSTGKEEATRLNEKNQLGWIDCLRLVEAQGEGENTRMRKMKRKMAKAERRWQIVDKATAWKFDKEKEDVKKKKEREMGLNQIKKRFFTTSTGKRILLKPRRPIEERNKGENEAKKRLFTATFGKTILLKPKEGQKGDFGESQIKKRFITTSTGKKILLKPRRLIEERKKAPGPLVVTKSMAAAAATLADPSKIAALAASTPRLQPGQFRLRPVGMPRLKRTEEVEEEGADERGSYDAPELVIFDDDVMEDSSFQSSKRVLRKRKEERKRISESDAAPDLVVFDDEDADPSFHPSKRVLQKRAEDRKRRADASPTRGSPPAKKATYRIEGGTIKVFPSTAERSMYRIASKEDKKTASTPANKPGRVSFYRPRDPSFSSPPPLSPHHHWTPSILHRTPATPAVPPQAERERAEREKKENAERAEKERKEMIEKANRQKQQEWEMRKNEATIHRQKAQIETQKRILGEIRKEMVTTFENADKTNKLVEATRRAMIGECHDFAEYRKLVDAREKLMNTLYEQTVEKMKTQVATEENRRRMFENYKRKAVRREKTLIKEIEHTKGQLDKVQEQQLASGLPKKAPSCTVPFTKSTKRSKLSRSSYVIEAVRRVLGDGVEGDEEVEREQVRAIIEKVQAKYGIERNMSVEQDRELCSKHEIGYRKRIHMKKFLAKLGLDVFCSQRAFDKMRLEMGEADGTEEVEIAVKREPRDRRTKKEKERDAMIAKKRMVDPREISLGRSGAEDDEASDVDIEEILVDEDYNMIEGGNQTGITDGGETSGAERERANRRYNMARFNNTRLLTSDEEYIMESDPDQPGPSNRYIPLPSGYTSSSTGRLVPIPPPSTTQSHYLHAAPILQPQQRMQQLQQGHNARRARGGARVRGGKL